MKISIFDFDLIASMDDFYEQSAEEWKLPPEFGRNLDALWDVVTGDLEMPIDIQFRNLSSGKLKTFEQLIRLFRDAEAEMDGDLHFSIFLKMG